MDEQLLILQNIPTVQACITCIEGVDPSITSDLQSAMDQLTSACGATTGAATDMVTTDTMSVESSTMYASSAFVCLER